MPGKNEIKVDTNIQIKNTMDLIANSCLAISELINDKTYTVPISLPEDFLNKVLTLSKFNKKFIDHFFQKEMTRLEEGQPRQSWYNDDDGVNSKDLFYSLYRIAKKEKPTSLQDFCEKIEVKFQRNFEIKVPLKKSGQSHSLDIASPTINAPDSPSANKSPSSSRKT